MEHTEGRLSERPANAREDQVPPYFPIDYTALSKARSDANKARHAVEREKYMGNYDLPSDVLARTHTALAGLSRKARRRLHRDAAELNLLAVLDPASGATTRDRLVAAAESARIAGLARESVQVVEHRVSFRGMAGGARPTRDVIEAKVVEAAGLPPIAGSAVGQPPASPDGAAAAPPAGGGGGG